MQTFDAVLFDLDGTLIDSAPGIFDSFEFTLAQYEMTVPQERLRRFLGPPLRESFAKLLPPDEVERAVEIYRAHYAEASGALTKLYPGTKELLSALREAGYILCLATSKVRYAALKLLDKLELTPYFDYIGGSSPDASLDTKTAVIRHVLAQPCVQDKRAVMVGDRDNGYAWGGGLRAAGGGRAVRLRFPRGAGTFCSAVSCAVRRRAACMAAAAQRSRGSCASGKGMTVFERYFCTFQNA